MLHTIIKNVTNITYKSN